MVAAAESMEMRTRFLWRALRARYRDNRTELEAIRRQIRPDDVVCDIGANKGSYLYWLSRWAGEVVAFEPQPALAEYLRNACRNVGLSNVIVEQSGVASRTETRHLYMPSKNSPGATITGKFRNDRAESIAVPVVSLDEYFAERRKPSLLKIDVEGAELEVFKGAERILTEKKPFIVFECEQQHLDSGSVKDVLTYLEQRGYSGQFIKGSELAPISDFDVNKHQKRTEGRFWEVAGYCNNFVFSAGT